MEGQFGECVKGLDVRHGKVVEGPRLPGVALRVIDVTPVDRDSGEGDFAEGRCREGGEDRIQAVLLQG